MRQQGKAYAVWGIALGIGLARPAGAGDWLQWGYDAAHSSNNPAESHITAANVSSLGILFKITLPAVADGAPAYLSAVPTVSGLKDLLFLTTKAGALMAIDAHTGSVAWSQPHPGVGFTTSSPAVDPDRQFVYSYGLDGFVHKHTVADGAEVTTGGWPQLASLKPSIEKGSSALAIATARNGETWLYCTHAALSDETADYQGHVTAIRLSDGVAHVFNASCSNSNVHFALNAPPDCPINGGGIWSRPGTVYDAARDRILLVTGNGTFDALFNGYDWGDSLFSLAPDATGSAGGWPLDSYTPIDYQHLQDLDIDLGSVSPAILPVPAGCQYAGLALLAGKDGMLRLLNLSNLSGQGWPGNIGGEVQMQSIPFGGTIIPQPSVWRNPSDGSTWAFVSNGNGIWGYRLDVDSSGNPTLDLQWSRFGYPGSSSIIAGNILYYAGAFRLDAVDPETGTAIWTDPQIGIIHWESPIVINGTLYITDNAGHLSAYTPSSASLGAMDVSPQSLAFQKPAGGPDPAPQLVTVTNYGAASITVSAQAAGGAWLSVSPGSIAIPAGQSRVFSVSVADSGYCANAGSITFSAPAVGNSPVSVPVTFEVTMPSSPVSYYTVAPCRVIDTRGPDGGIPYGPPPLAGGSATRDFLLTGFCGIPAGASAVALNVTVVGATNSGNLRLFPAGTCTPASSAINFHAGSPRANNAVVPLPVSGATAGVLSVESDIFPGTANLIVDVSGYFQ